MIDLKHIEDFNYLSSKCWKLTCTNTDVELDMIFDDFTTYMLKNYALEIIPDSNSFENRLWMDSQFPGRNRISARQAGSGRLTISPTKTKIGIELYSGIDPVIDISSFGKDVHFQLSTIYDGLPTYEFIEDAIFCVKHIVLPDGIMTCTLNFRNLKMINRQLSTILEKFGVNKEDA